jgi:hypothetical protein
MVSVRDDICNAMWAARGSSRTWFLCTLWMCKII